MKSGLPSKNVTSDFAPEVARWQQGGGVCCAPHHSLVYLLFNRTQGRTQNLSPHLKSVAALLPKFVSKMDLQEMLEQDWNTCRSCHPKHWRCFKMLDFVTVQCSSVLLYICFCLVWLSGWIRGTGITPIYLCFMQNAGFNVWWICVHFFHFMHFMHVFCNSHLCCRKRALTLCGWSEDAAGASIPIIDRFVAFSSKHDYFILNVITTSVTVFQNYVNDFPNILKQSLDTDIPTEILLCLISRGSFRKYLNHHIIDFIKETHFFQLTVVFLLCTFYFS